ncbi:MAG: N-formylglutamate amidohydrolase [Candidatus Hodarchaeota archaeon]
MNLRKYFEIGEGSVPIVLSTPHGGYKRPKVIPDKQVGQNLVDINTYIIAKQIIKSIKNISIYYILNKIHRSKIDLNRPPISDQAFNQSSNMARNIHFLYHDQLRRFAQESVSKYGRTLIIDLHGFTKPKKNYPDIILGHVFGNTLDLFQNSNEENCDRYWGCSQLHQELSKFFSLDDGLSISKFNLGYSGGYITQQFYNVKQISAIQVEVAKHIRLDFEFSSKFVKSCVRAIINSVKSN